MSIAGYDLTLEHVTVSKHEVIFIWNAGEDQKVNKASFYCTLQHNKHNWLHISWHVDNNLCYHTCDRVAMLQLEICKIFGWRFGLVTGDFLSTYLMRVFVYWCFPFICFGIEPTASHFNIYCLHFCLISSVSYDEWRIKTVFIIYS